MQSTRFVQRTHAALVLAVCVGLVSPALTWADSPLDRLLVSSSVPVLRNNDRVEVARPVSPTSEPIKELSRAQIQEAADSLLLDLGVVVQNLVLVMVFWDLPTPQGTPVPDTFVPLNVQPPPSLTDIPGGNGPPDPPPTQQSPEPGTLLAGLAGAGAFLYRYYRRRRGKVPAIDELEEMNENEVALVL